jgi:putative membrane protein
MTAWLITWLLTGLAFVIVANVVPGFQVNGFAAALIAALVFGFFNGTIGLLLKFITFPLTVITLGIFWFVINAMMLKLTALFVPGFRINGFGPAFLGAIVFSVVNMLLRWLVP